MDFLISAIDNYPHQSVQYITYGLLLKHGSLHLGGMLGNFDQMDKVPTTFFATQARVETMLSIIVKGFTSNPRYEQYVGLLRKLHQS